MKDDRLYLDRILERINQIERFTQGGHQTFLDSDLVQEATLRCFEIIGEAARKTSDNLQKQNPQIPWGQIIAFRNILIHDYVNVDLNRVWQVIDKELPVLKPQNIALIHQLDALLGQDN